MPIRRKTKGKRKKVRKSNYMQLKDRIVMGDDYHLHKRRKEVKTAYKKGNITKNQRDKLNKLAR